MGKQEDHTITASAVPRALPVLPLRNSVVFPHQVSPLAVGRDRSKLVIEEAQKDEGHLVLVSQADESVETPTERDIFWVGTLAKILKVYNLPDGTQSVLVQGLRRVRLLSVLHAEPYLRAVVRDAEETNEEGMNIEAMATSVQRLFKRAVELSPGLNEEHLAAVLNVESTVMMVDLVSSMVSAGLEEKQKLLETFSLKERLERLTLLLTRTVETLELGNKIQSEVQDGISKTQREYYLREQLKAIQKELGDDQDNIEQKDLREKIEEAKLTEDARQVAEKEFQRLSQMNPASAEYTVARTYLDWILDLPWMTGTQDALDIGARHKCWTGTTTAWRRSRRESSSTSPSGS